MRSTTIDATVGGYYTSLVSAVQTAFASQRSSWNNEKMNNLSENKVILTDEKYKSVRSNVVTWHICLVVKLALTVLTIFEFTHLELFVFNPFKWFFSAAILVDNLFCAMVLAILALAAGFVLLYVQPVALYIVHDLQMQLERRVNSIFLDGLNHVDFLGIFPGKGIRLAQREVHRYRRQKKLQEKGHKEKQQESKDDN
ncbi:MAG: hypothetical protein IJM54_04480 [Thermoguttaceae bacterium]|nr:hypothetical protein [Thermoguttaceae bacterium]